jgi:hypothetical protein
MVDEIIGHNLIQYYMLIKIFPRKMLEQDDHHELSAKEIVRPGK